MGLPIIGIVGGVGPYAGLDLNRKIFDNTVTDGTDQDHLEVLLFSAGRQVPDRTEYLLRKAGENPAEQLFRAVETLARAGARIMAIACNTAHAPEIITPLKEKILSLGLEIELVDMIEETALFIKENFGKGAKAGLLATEGTISAGVYDRLREERLGRIELLLPSREIQKLVHQAIYDRKYGIKACSNPVTERAVKECRLAVRHLAEQGAETVILGCTELPLALPQSSIEGASLLDPTWITARALVARVALEKLKPWP
ncbi:MAG TPA: amino acid racemase [archaeon]|nr:amino acid racemase [archaeon]